MSAVTVAIAPIPLARSGRRLLIAPAILFVAGSVDERMKYALKRAKDVSVFVYEVAFTLRPAW